MYRNQDAGGHLLKSEITPLAPNLIFHLTLPPAEPPFDDRLILQRSENCLGSSEIRGQRRVAKGAQSTKLTLVDLKMECLSRASKKISPKNDSLKLSRKEVSLQRVVTEGQVLY